MTTKGPDDTHRLRTAYLRLRAAVRDPISGLFATPLYFDEIRALLRDRSRIAALWVTLGERRLIETVYGWEAYDRALGVAARALGTMREDLLPEGTILATAGVHADAFNVFVPADTGGRDLEPDSVMALAAQVGERLEAGLSATAAGRSPVPSSVRVGAALLTDNPFHRFERRVYAALDEARSIAERPRDSQRLAWLGELQRVLRERDVHAVFQPIFDLATKAIVAVEAYSRGPEASVFRLPRVMFSVGRDAGLSSDLDRLCRRSALEALVGGVAPPLVFLNTSAENLVDPDWAAPETLALLRQAGLSPEQVVLEVPEGQIALDPETYVDALAWLRSVGYRLSLDDVGSGPRSTFLVEALRPSFLKFDLTLVRGLADDQLRRELVRSLVQLAERAGARLIAERVESEDERAALLDCGASWGQGYLFAREMPRSSPVAIPVDAPPLPRRADD